jgi:YjbE family integral membrane protein
MDSHWWLGLLQIIGIDIILSGDNALVIALACRSLPKEQRRLGIWLGTGAAVALRVAMAVAIVYVLTIPLLKLAGAVMLLWIAIKLLIPERGSDDALAGGRAPAGSVWTAIKIIVVADAVMSLDNVISVAAAARGHVDLLVLGIAISIPLMVIGSQMMLWLLDRYSWILVLGAALLGWIAGELAISDPWVVSAIGGWAVNLRHVLPAACALFVVAAGLVLASRARQAHRQHSGREN